MSYWFFPIIVVSFLVGAGTPARADTYLLNVSYDSTREFYREYNVAFARYWKQKTGETVIPRQSHGGSGKQARAVLNGLDADVVSFALAYDIDSLTKHSGLLSGNWQKRLPSHSSPFTSTVVFLVRKGNPKGIKNWDDLTRPGLVVVMPNPKSSGGARWDYLAAWGYALRQPHGSPATAKDFVTKLYRNVPTLDASARAATMTFIKKHQGDVLVTWEDEALLVTKQWPQNQVELVAPPESILAEPVVAVVEKNALRHDVRLLAQSYLEYLYSPEAQELAASHYYRPRLQSVAMRHAATFPTMKLFTLGDVCGNWRRANQEHFANGAMFDKIYPLR